MKPFRTALLFLLGLAGGAALVVQASLTSRPHPLGLDSLPAPEGERAIARA